MPGRAGPRSCNKSRENLCRGVGSATPAVEIQPLPRMVVSQGTPFSVYVSEVCLLVANMRCVGQVVPEDVRYELRSRRE